MTTLTLSNKAKKALEGDYFREMRKKIILEAKRTLIDSEIADVQTQMDGLVAMLGYKPVADMPSSESEAKNEQ